MSNNQIVLSDSTEMNKVLYNNDTLIVQGNITSKESGKAQIKISFNGGLKEHIIKEVEITDKPTSYREEFVYSDGKIRFGNEIISNQLYEDIKYNIFIWAELDNIRSNQETISFYVNNSEAPQILTDKTNLGKINKEIRFTYNVKDQDPNSILKVKEFLNNQETRVYEKVFSETDIDYKLSQEIMNDLEVGKQYTIKITAENENQIGIKEISFVKKNNAPKISGTNMSIGKRDKPFQYKYSVEDLDTKDTYTITEKINNEILNVYKNQTTKNLLSLEINEEIFNKLNKDEEHLITIEADDGKQKSIRYIYFTKVDKVITDGIKIVQLQDNYGNNIYPMSFSSEDNEGLNEQEVKIIIEKEMNKPDNALGNQSIKESIKDLGKHIKNDITTSDIHGMTLVDEELYRRTEKGNIPIKLDKKNIKGKLDISEITGKATLEEAKEGTNDTKYMTPRKVKHFILTYGDGTTPIFANGSVSNCTWIDEEGKKITNDLEIVSSYVGTYKKSMKTKETIDFRNYKNIIVEDSESDVSGEYTNAKVVIKILNKKGDVLGESTRIAGKGNNKFSFELYCKDINEDAHISVDLILEDGFSGQFIMLKKILLQEG